MCRDILDPSSHCHRPSVVLKSYSTISLLRTCKVAVCLRLEVWYEFQNRKVVWWRYQCWPRTSFLLVTIFINAIVLRVNSFTPTKDGSNWKVVLFQACKILSLSRCCWVIVNEEKRLRFAWSNEKVCDWSMNGKGSVRMISSPFDLWRADFWAGLGNRVAEEAKRILLLRRSHVLVPFIKPLHPTTGNLIPARGVNVRSPDGWDKRLCKGEWVKKWLWEKGGSEHFQETTEAHLSGRRWIVYGSKPIKCQLPPLVIEEAALVGAIIDNRRWVQSRGVVALSAELLRKMSIVKCLISIIIIEATGELMSFLVRGEVGI